MSYDPRTIPPSQIMFNRDLAPRCAHLPFKECGGLKWLLTKQVYISFLTTLLWKSLEFSNKSMLPVAYRPGCQRRHPASDLSRQLCLDSESFTATKEMVGTLPLCSHPDRDRETTADCSNAACRLLARFECTRPR